MSIKQLKALTQSVEIFYADSHNNQCSRVFKLTEHTRDELDEFIKLQVACGRAAEREAEALESLADGETAGELTSAAFAVPAKVAAPVVAYCLRFPEDNEPAPDVEWIVKHLTARRMKQVIELQEELDGIDDAMKKNVNLIQAMALQKRLEKMQKMQKDSKKSKGAKIAKTPKRRLAKGK